MTTLIGILLTLASGLFLYIGALLIYNFSNKDKIISFSIALGLIVLIILNLTHIFPESIELLGNKFVKIQSYAFLFLMSLLGYVLLKILDKFIPHHSHSSHENKMKHVAYITTVTLFIHNIIEGISLYSASILSIKTGIIFSLGIGVHNIALGITLTGQLFKENNSKKEIIKMLGILVLANLVGAILSILFNINAENSFILGIILAITFGMLIYIIIAELWPSYKASKESTAKVIGLLTGGALMILTGLF